MTTAPPGYPTLPPHPPPPLRPELPDGVEPTPTGPQWKAWMAFVALIAGFAAAVVGAIFVAIGAAAAGASFDDPPASVNILALVVQDVCLVGAAIVFARMGGGARPGTSASAHTLLAGSRLERAGMGRLPDRHRASG